MQHLLSCNTYCLATLIVQHGTISILSFIVLRHVLSIIHPFDTYCLTTHNSHYSPIFDTPFYYSLSLFHFFSFSPHLPPQLLSIHQVIQFGVASAVDNRCKVKYIQWSGTITIKTFIIPRGTITIKTLIVMQHLLSWNTYCPVWDNKCLTGNLSIKHVMIVQIICLSSTWW